MSPFRTENTPKISVFMVKNDAQTTSECLQKKFEKVEKTTFLALKMVKMILS